MISSHSSSFLKLNNLYKFSFILSVIGVGVLLFDFGYSQKSEVQQSINIYYFIVLFLGMITTAIRYLNKDKSLKFNVIIFDIISSIVILSVLILHFTGMEINTTHTYLYDDVWVKIAIFLTFIREYSAWDINYSRAFLHPAQLFILSFIFIIFFGAFLLVLPNATTAGISFTDALFGKC